MEFARGAGPSNPDLLFTTKPRFPNVAGLHQSTHTHSQNTPSPTSIVLLPEKDVKNKNNEKTLRPFFHRIRLPKPQVITTRSRLHMMRPGVRPFRAVRNWALRAHESHEERRVQKFARPTSFHAKEGGQGTTCRRAIQNLRARFIRAIFSSSAAFCFLTLKTSCLFFSRT